MKHLKKVFGLAAFALLVLVSGPAHAGSKYYVALTTVTANSGASGEFTAAPYPNITGNLYVRKLVVGNSTSTVAQTISVYDTCTTTTAATLKFQVYSGAASMVVPAVQEFNFLPQSFKLTNPCFKKNSTSSTVDLTVFYE